MIHAVLFITEIQSTMIMSNSWHKHSTKVNCRFEKVCYRIEQTVLQVATLFCLFFGKAFFLCPITYYIKNKLTKQTDTHATERAFSVLITAIYVRIVSSENYLKDSSKFDL